MSFRALRRSRLLAGLLLLASPAAAGTILPVLHPCPVDMPWLAQAQHPAAGHAGHGVHQVVPQDAPAEAHHGTTCNCIGSCTAASFALAPIAHQVAARVPLTPSIP